MTSQVRVLGDKTFNAIGYGGMGLSMYYGAVGTDEERLKVRRIHFLRLRDGFLTPARTKGSRCRLRVRMYLLGHS